MSTCIRKAVLSALPGIATQSSTATMDPNTKTVRGKIKISIANNTYDRLENDEDNTPNVYKKSWILDTACSGNYADDETIVKDKKSIEPGTGINVGCANTGVMQQKGVAKLPFDNLPTGTDAVEIFHKMHSPLLGSGKFVKEGKCTLVFGRKNAHIVKG